MPGTKTNENNENISNANPFETPQENAVEEKIRKAKDTLFTKLSNQSKEETFRTKLLCAGSFVASLYLIAVLMKFSYYHSKAGRYSLDYSPIGVMKTLLLESGPATFFMAVLLSAFIAYICMTVYMKHLKFIENDRVVRAKSGAYGTSDWINNESAEMESTFDISEDLSHPGYLPLGVYKNKVYSVPRDPKFNQFKNQNICVIGGAGSGKSFSFIGPMVMCRVENEESFVVTDTKGDLYRTYAKLCEKHGYNVVIFNTNSFKYSDSWNCLEDASQASESEIYEYIDRIANIFIRNTSEGERADYWQKNEHDLLRCLLHLVCRDSSYEGNRTFKALIDLINGEESEIKSKLEVSDPKVQHAARSYLSATDAKLRENYRSGLANRLQIYRTPMVAEALSADGIDMEKAVHEKTAIFVITKDTETTYDAITSLFIVSLYIKLCEISNSRYYKGSLMTPFWFIIDELCNMAAIEDLSRKISTNRSRKINFCLAIQSISQLDNKYPRLASNILANCGIVPFLGCDDLDTAQYVSKRAGAFTQVEITEMAERNVLTRKFQPVLHIRESKRLSKKELLAVSDASQFEAGKIVDFIIGKHPFRGKTYGASMHWLYKEVEETEPSDRVPEWYPRFCEEHPELLAMGEREYIPSDSEVQRRNVLKGTEKKPISKRRQTQSDNREAPLILSSEEREAVEKNNEIEKENQEMLIARLRGEIYRKDAEDISRSTDEYSTKGNQESRAETGKNTSAAAFAVFKDFNDFDFEKSEKGKASDKTRARFIEEEPSYIQEKERGDRIIMEDYAADNASFDDFDFEEDDIF